MQAQSRVCMHDVDSLFLVFLSFLVFSFVFNWFVDLISTGTMHGSLS